MARKRAAQPVKKTVKTAKPAANKTATKAKAVKAPAKKRITFTLDAPHAEAVLLTGSFCNWDSQPVALKKDKSGVWKAAIALDPGTYEYRFLVDGQWRDDPNCAERVLNSFGSENCVVKVQAAKGK